MISTLWLIRQPAYWSIALGLLAQQGGVAPLGEGRSADLFAYLSREILAQLDVGDRRFLLATAPLIRLDPSVCDAITG